MRRAIVAIVVVVAALQLVPYGYARDNPPARSEPAWDSPRTRELAVRACFDCHSNETKWPWYGAVAPMSWLVQRDIDEGRRALDFSNGGRGREAGEAGEGHEMDEMPPSLYLLIHPEARLSTGERIALERGLRVTLGTRGEDAEREGD